MATKQTENPLANLTEVNIAKARLLLEQYMDGGDSVFLHGTFGIGKTELIHQIAADKAKINGSHKVIDFRLNLREPVDMRGIPMPDMVTMTTKWMTPDELPRVDRDGKFGTFFMDEMNTGSDQMFAVAMGLALERRIGDYQFPSSWNIVAAGNRVKDKAAVRRLPAPLRNRFAHIVIKPEIESWVAWAKKANIDPRYIAFLNFRSELLHAMPEGDENAFPSPRTHVKAAKYVNAPKELRQTLMAGLVGNNVASEAESFFRMYETHMSLPEIVADPDKAPVPKEASVRYAVCVGLSRMATRKNWSAICKFANRLPPEHRMLLIIDATERDPSLKDTKEYTSFAIKDQKYTVQAH